jgi:hypothetical protein
MMKYGYDVDDEEEEEEEEVQEGEYLEEDNHRMGLDEVMEGMVVRINTLDENEFLKNQMNDIEAEEDVADDLSHMSNDSQVDLMLATINHLVHNQSQHTTISQTPPIRLTPVVTPATLATTYVTEHIQAMLNDRLFVQMVQRQATKRCIHLCAQQWWSDLLQSPSLTQLKVPSSQIMVDEAMDNDFSLFQVSLDDTSPSEAKMSPPVSDGPSPSSPAASVFASSTSKAQSKDNPSITSIENSTPTTPSTSAVFLKCLENIPPLHQRSFLQLCVLLMRSSFVDLIQQALPILSKQIEKTFVVLSKMQKELREIHSGVETSNDIPNNSLFFSGWLDCTYSEQQKERLSDSLQRHEKLLKRRLQSVTNVSKRYYDTVDQKIVLWNQWFLELAKHQTSNPLSKSELKQFKRFAMTDVIDYMRDSQQTLVAQVLPVVTIGVDVAPREIPSPHSIKATLKAHKDHKSPSGGQEKPNKHFHAVDMLYASKVRYDEAVALKASAKKMLETHVKQQMQHLQDMLSTLDRALGTAVDDNNSLQEVTGDLVVSNTQQADETDAVSLLTNNESSKKFRTVLSQHAQNSRLSMGNTKVKSRPSSAHCTPRATRVAKPGQLSTAPGRRPSSVRNLIAENRNATQYLHGQTRREDLRRSHTVELLNALDLSCSPTRMPLKERIPSQQTNRAHSANSNHLSHTELKTAVQSLNYIDVNHIGIKSKQILSSLHMVDATPTKKYALTKDTIEQYQFSPKRLKQVFRNNPIVASEKQRLAEQRRTPSNSPPRSGGSSPIDRRQLLAVESSASSSNLDDLIMGRSFKKKTSPCPKQAIVSDSTINSNTPTREDCKLSAVDEMTLASYAEASRAAEDADSIHHQLQHQNQYQQRAQGIPSTLLNDDRHSFEWNDNTPLLWAGDIVNDESAQIPINNFQTVGLEASCVEVQLGDKESLFLKFKDVFDQLGIIESDETLLSQASVGNQIEMAQHALYALTDDSSLTASDYQQIEDETEVLSQQTLSLMIFLKSTVKADLLQSFSKYYSSSKLLRKECELDILEIFIDKSLQASRLESTAGLVTLDLDNVKPIQSKNQKKSKRLDINLIPISGLTNELNLASVPFRTGLEKGSVSKNHREALSATRFRSPVEQRLDVQLTTMKALRRKLQTSLFNLLEIVTADCLYPLISIMTTEIKYVGCREAESQLKDAIQYGGSMGIDRNQLNFSSMLNNEILRSLLSLDLKLLTIDALDEIKEHLTMTMISNASLSFDKATNTILREAKETSGALCH